ncbi:DUF4221 family protein [Algoriphagus halophilus]|uniref:DUF4221 family protein n=1 Tax=Algoriphagus halophilus TaxID=226505 RepID=UPI00358F7FF2
MDYKADTTNISIDLKTDPSTRAMQYINGNLYWWNSNRGTISVFNISSKNQTSTIKLHEDGPNGIGSPLGFFVINSDSIYIPTMAYEINLVNSKGQRVAKYDYNNLSKLGVVIPSMTRYSNMAQADNSGKIYFKMRDLNIISPSDLNEKALLEYPPILSFDINNQTFRYLDFKVPPSFLKFENSIDFGIAASQNSILLLHNQSSTLLEVNFNGVDYEQHQLQSTLIKNFSNIYYKSPRMSSSIDNNMRLLYKSAQNLGMAYDTKNKMIYRFGWPGEEIPDGIDPMEYSANLPYFILSIYDDEDYSLLQEFTLPRNTYLAHHYFVDEKGLNLFPMHPDNPEFNEDEMVIHTFDFSSLKK